MLFISFEKLFSFSRYLSFCPNFCGHLGKRLKKVNFKPEISQTGKQIIIIHILSNIWRSKDSKGKKYGQFTEYNMKNNFLQKSYKECGEEANSRPFYNYSKLRASLDRQLLCSYIVIQLNVITFNNTVCFYSPSGGLPKCIKTG